MSLPDSVAEVIRLANIQEREERKLQDMRDEKAAAQATVAEKNQQINDQQVIVQAGRSALKTAVSAL